MNDFLNGRLTRNPEELQRVNVHRTHALNPRALRIDAHLALVIDEMPITRETDLDLVGQLDFDHHFVLVRLQFLHGIDSLPFSRTFTRVF